MIRIKMMISDQEQGRIVFCEKKYYTINIEKMYVFFMESKMIMISTCTHKNLCISFDILGPSDIFVLEMSVTSSN